MKIKLVILAVLLVFSIAFVLADNETEDSENNETSKQKNMTFGLCVSEAAKIRQTCYAETKNASLECAKTAKANTDKQQGKEQGKQCSSTYKAEKKDCKNSFKAAKKTCIQIYKPGFWQRMRYSLK